LISISKFQQNKINKFSIGQKEFPDCMIFFWLTPKAIAALFGAEVPAINKHLKNIFETGE